MNWRDRATRSPHIRLWYPTDCTYAAAGSWRWLALKFHGLSNPRPNSTLAARSIAGGTSRFPLILYFSGWPGTSVDNHLLIEELAVRGYLVAALTYPDAGAQPMDYSSERSYLATVQTATQRVVARARDATAFIDDVLQNEQSPADAQAWKNRIDPERIGIMGFSLGGAVAAEAATLDPRLRGVVNIDGRHWATALDTGVVQPYMFIGEPLPLPTTEELAAVEPDRRYNALLDHHDYSQLARNLQRNGGMQVVISRARHMDFTDGSRRRGVRRILHAYVTAFFDQVLKESPAGWLEAAASPFTGVKTTRWPRPQPQVAGGVQT